MTERVKKLRLGVNIDHVATVRQARGIDYPDPIEAALIAEKAGADGITAHLREDRRHIQDDDIKRLAATLSIPLNLEMALTDEMVNFALQIKPKHCCLVPEKRQELTTEGGLDVVKQLAKMTESCQKLQRNGTEVSLFIDPDKEQIDAALTSGAKAIEIHTGAYADASSDFEQKAQLEKIKDSVQYAHQKGLIVNAGHGLHYQNVQAIAAIPELNELNIGHSIVARAVMVGMAQAVTEMFECLR